MFLSRIQDLNHPIKSKIRELIVEEYSQQKEQLKFFGLEAEISDYSEVDNYLMAARIIGKDKTGKNIFAE